MAGTEHVKCAKCNVPLEGTLVDGEPQGEFTCPICGTGDTYENVMREIGEFASEKAADVLSAEFEQVARHSDVMTFTNGHRPKKVYRFIIDLDL